MMSPYSWPAKSASRRSDYATTHSNSSHKYLLLDLLVKVCLFLDQLVLSHLALIVPVDFLDILCFGIFLGLGEGDSQVGQLLAFLLDTHSIFNFTAEFNQKLLPGLPRIILYHIKILKSELLSPESNGNCTLIKDLAIHRFYQINPRLVSFDLSASMLTLYDTIRSTRFSMVIVECIYWSQMKLNTTLLGTLHRSPLCTLLIYSYLVDKLIRFIAPITYHNYIQNGNT